MNSYFFSVKGEINNKINLALYFMILAYVVSLFIRDTPVITNALTVLILVGALLKITSSRNSFMFCNSKINLAIIVFYIYQLGSVLVSSNLNAGLNILIFRLPLLVFPLSFLFIDFEKKIWDKIVLFYALATVFASFLGFLFGCYNAFVESDTGFMYNDNIVALLGKQAVYFAYYVAVAIVVILFQLKQKNSFVCENKFWFGISLTWLLFILFMLASRTTMFVLFAILIGYIWVYVFRNKKYLEGGLLIFTLIISGVIVSKFFPKTLNRFKGTTEINYRFDNKNTENHFNAAYDPEKWNGTNTRAAIWACAVDLWTKQPIFGTGLGDRNYELMKKYEENKFWYALTTQKNTHNQYLDVLLSMGIVGLILFLFCFFILPFQVFFKNKQLFPALIFILLMFALLTENMLDRQQGLVLISFILPISVRIK